MLRRTNIVLIVVALSVLVATWAVPSFAAA
jgi:hypothetical protein